MHDAVSLCSKIYNTHAYTCAYTHVHTLLRSWRDHIKTAGLQVFTFAYMTYLNSYQTHVMFHNNKFFKLIKQRPVWVRSKPSSSFLTSWGSGITWGTHQAGFSGSQGLLRDCVGGGLSDGPGSFLSSQVENLSLSPALGV